MSYTHEGPGSQTFDIPQEPKKADTNFYLEYYCGTPNIRVSFEVKADSTEEAQQKGEKIIKSLKRVACYEYTR